MTILQTFVIAGLGVAAFHVLGIPLPWLLGPMAACLIAALLGMRLQGKAPLNAAMRTILGVAVGATLTPAVIASLPGMWTTLILVPIMLAVIGFLGVPYFTRICGYDFPTAYYATMPGGLQDMIAFGEEAGGNVRALSLIHATRVLIIVVALPFLLSGIWDADLNNPPGVPIATVPLGELALMVLAAAFGWWAAVKVGLFGASILGPLLATAVLAMTDVLHFRPPAEAIWAAQFFIGMVVGTKYAGITIEEIRRDLLAGIGFCVILAVVTVGMLAVIFELNLAPGQEALLAFAPGGQAELAVLALIVGADVAFVVSHHVLRIFVVILGAPLAVRLFRPKQ